MKFVAKPYHGLPCALEVFMINGIDADLEEFGSGFDEGSEYAEDYACGNRVFEALSGAPAGVCARYGITKDEWFEIAHELESILHVGSCGWCI